jgi:hypothetical protein
MNKGMDTLKAFDKYLKENNKNNEINEEIITLFKNLHKKTE